MDCSQEYTTARAEEITWLKTERGYPCLLYKGAMYTARYVYTTGHIRFGCHARKGCNAYVKVDKNLQEILEEATEHVCDTTKNQVTLKIAQSTIKHLSATTTFTTATILSKLVVNAPDIQSRCTIFSRADTLARQVRRENEKKNFVNKESWKKHMLRGMYLIYIHISIYLFIIFGNFAKFL